MSKDLEKALNIAKLQKENHNAQVSGCWSINGVDFCIKYDLDFDKAKNYEQKMCEKNVDNYFILEKSKIENRIGDLTEEQEERLLEESQCTCAELEQYYFWLNLVRQIEEKLEK